MRGLRVLVTGAGGSIGSVLCEHILAEKPDRLIQIDHSAASLQNKKDAAVVDVRDEDNLRSIFLSSRPEIVIHAAANKHVPLLEDKPWEAVDHNILGTRNVVRLCREFDVKKMILVSTDKAVDPVNIMGYSKRVAELYTLAAGYSCVRFVNVFGSSGSVVEIFRKQIAEGGPITVTSPDMTRYFMLPDEACRLILNAVSLAESGDIFILDDGGNPVKITDLAHQLMREAGKDVEIRFTGIRPGDRIHEIPMLPNPNAEKTSIDKIWRLRTQSTLSAEGIIAPLFQFSGPVREILQKIALTC